MSSRSQGSGQGDRTGALWLEAGTLRAAGVRHGFSTREGGVSEGAFASLNCGLGVGDAPVRVAENLMRLREAAGVGEVLQVQQVHGRRVIVVGATPCREQLEARQADALVAEVPDQVVGVRTADCVPILGYAREGRGAPRVVAIHAGWRGTLAGVAARGLKALVGEGALARTGRLASVRLAIGPSIRRCCYEVDERLATTFRQALGEGVIAWSLRGRPLLDLVEANLRILEGAGLCRDQVEVLNACTGCEARRFFSHRRDGGRTGRHLAFVEVPPADGVVSLT